MEKWIWRRLARTEDYDLTCYLEENHHPKEISATEMLEEIAIIQCTKQLAQWLEAIMTHNFDKKS